MGTVKGDVVQEIRAQVQKIAEGVVEGLFADIKEIEPEDIRDGDIHLGKGGVRRLADFLIENYPDRCNDDPVTVAIGLLTEKAHQNALAGACDTIVVDHDDLRKLTEIRVCADCGALVTGGRELCGYCAGRHKWLEYRARAAR